MNSNRNIFITLLLFLMMSSFLFVVATNVPSPFGSFWYFYAPIWLMAILILKPYIFSEKFVLVVFVTGLITIIVLENVIWNYMSDWYRNKILYEFYSFIIVSTVISYFSLSEDYLGLALISKWAFIFILITSLMTFIATSIDPTVARNSANNFIDSPQQKALYILTGCGGYNFGQALCLLFPILIFLVKYNYQNLFSRRFLIVSIIFLFIVIVKMQYFANVITAIFAIGMSLLGTKKIKTTIGTATILLIVIFFIPLSTYSELLRAASLYFDSNSEIYSKLNDTATFLLNIGYGAEATGVSHRLDRYPMLFEAFMNSPFLGDASYKSNYSTAIELGGHLHWMSLLTVLGIFGFAIYIFVLKTLFKHILGLFNKYFSFYYIISIATLILNGLLKNIGGFESWVTLFIVIPGIYYFPLLNKKME